MDIETLKLFYTYFYRKVLKIRPSFLNKNDKVLNSFINLIQEEYGDSVGEDWLFDYLIFQFNKFSSAETKMKIQLNWVFGKKALKSWKERNKEYHKYFDNKFKDLYNLKRSDLISSNLVQISNEYKSRERNRFKDIRKLLHCLELSLYDENSADCKFCKFKEKCYAV